MSDEPAFAAAYDAALAPWPVPVEALDVPTPSGPTRVHRCGPADGPPVVFLPGGGATSLAWLGVAHGLGRTHRLHAVDLVGDVGRSIPTRPPRTAGDFVRWVGAVLDGLGPPAAHLVGHSYGAWIALRTALDAPARVRRLALLDPTSCVAGYRPAYLLRALPLLARPTPDRFRAFLRWETGGAALDPAWLEVAALGAGLPTSLVHPRRPRAAELRALDVPVLVVLAGRSRAHDVRRVAARARTLLPDVDVVELPDATHHTIPVHDPGPLVAVLQRYLREPPGAGGG